MMRFWSKAPLSSVMIDSAALVNLIAWNKSKEKLKPGTKENKQSIMRAANLPFSTKSVSKLQIALLTNPFAPQGQCNFYHTTFTGGDPFNIN
jgi:hypothetical protein